MWIVSSGNKVFQTEFEIGSQIFNLVTENGNKLDIFESSDFGKVFVFNNKTILLESFGFIYGEALAHIPVCSHYNPKDVLLVNSPSSLVALELSKYKSINIDFKPLDGELLLALDNYGIGKGVCERQKNINLISSVASDKKYDIIIYDGIYDESVEYLGANNLKNDGLVLFGLNDLVMDNGSNVEMLQKSGNLGIVNLPFHLHCYPVFPKSYAISSKKYHPVADLNAQRADMLEGVRYYNRYIHESCFELPKFISQKYRRAIKI